jgi:hypothetical protein
LAGCSAVVKTPYNSPTVQVPQQFQYDVQKNKNVNLTINGGHYLMMLN